MHHKQPAPTSRKSALAAALATLVALAGAAAQVSPATGAPDLAPKPHAQQPPPPPAVPLQAQLGQIQQQAQRQLSQLNGLVLNAVGNSSRYSNVLEAISSVGKVIHQQISAAANPNHVNIVASGAGPLAGPGGSLGSLESANTKKNEYQADLTGTQAAAGSPQPQPPPAAAAANYREQGEFLRQEIARRAGQLQQVVAGATDLLKNNGDVIMRRLLDQMSARLDQAKAKADRIISVEPAAMNEVTVRALATINTGLNSLNNIIANIVTRMDLANKQDQQRLAAGEQAGAPLTLQQRLQQAAADPALPQLLEPTRLKANLHQLSQQFQQALNGSSLHQQLALIRTQRLQQLAAMGANPLKGAPGAPPPTAH